MIVIAHAHTQYHLIYTKRFHIFIYKTKC